MPGMAVMINSVRSDDGTMVSLNCRDKDVTLVAVLLAAGLALATPRRASAAEGVAANMAKEAAMAAKVRDNIFSIP